MATLECETVDVTVDEKDVVPGATQILEAIRPQWNKEDFDISPLPGGYANSMVKCKNKTEAGEDEIVIRVHGKGAELMVDHEEEILHARILAAAGVGAQVYCTFNNGFAYQFLPGERFKAEVDFDESSARLLTNGLVKFHATDVDSVLEKMNKSDGNMKYKLDTAPKTFKTLRKMLSSCPETMKKEEKNEKYRYILETKEEMLRELKSLEEHVQSQNIPIVFSHCDWRNENIIYNKEKGSVTGVDLEFSGMTFEAYDLAHHFAIGTFWNPMAEAIDWCPTKEQELQWVRIYLEEKAKFEGKDPQDITDDEVKMWYAWTMKLFLAAMLFLHFFTWIQEAHSPLPVEFLRFSHMFREVYFSRKEEILAL